jgi:2-dehydro-3-deoxyphosphooctonate aldolase (KDO 8-P synthase)
VKQTVYIQDIPVGNGAPFAVFAGPCQLESLDHARMLAERIAKACQATGRRFVFKGSFDKANRSSHTTGRGVGIGKGLEILHRVGEEFQCPTVTDVHDAAQCAEVATVVDVLQIPAFLCRQTDLLIAAAETGRVIHVKKGQFLAPWDMKNVAAKIAAAGNTQILLCDRGTSFGYNTLVTDFRGLPIMAQTGYPVVFDATHSVQQPGGQGTTSGGQREFVPVLARAAVAVGIDALFIETHEDPDNAPSDGPNMVPITAFQGLLETLVRIENAVRA